MAIHDKFEVRVFVKGQPAQEYDNPESLESNEADSQNTDQESGPVVERCIESMPGENFAIEVKISQGFKPKPDQSLRFEVRLDGRRADSIIARRSLYRKGRGWVGTRDGARSCIQGVWQNRKFKFGMLRTSTELSKEKMDAAVVAKIGSIQIVVKLVEVIKKTPSGLYGADNTISDNKVSEQHLKGCATDCHTR